MSTDSSGSVDILIQVVTCPDAPLPRRLSAERQLEAMARDFPGVIVEGYAPQNAHVKDIYDRGANRRAMNRPLSGAETAAYATHRKAWRGLLDSPYEASLVLEDDFLIENSEMFLEALTRAPAVCQGRDIVKLFDFPKSGGNLIVRTVTVGPLKLVQWRYPTAGAGAYFITRNGASKLLSREKIFRPVDEDFKYFWEKCLSVWSLVPSPISENGSNLGGSLIDASRKKAKSRRLPDRLRGNLIRLHWKLNCYWRNRPGGG
jgi:glycosyl transferase family 25